MKREELSKTLIKYDDLKLKKQFGLHSLCKNISALWELGLRILHFSVMHHNDW